MIKDGQLFKFDQPNFQSTVPSWGIGSGLLNTNKSPKKKLVTGRAKLELRQGSVIPPIIPNKYNKQDYGISSNGQKLDFV